MNIQNIISVIGIPSIMIGLIYIGRKLQILDWLEKSAHRLENRANNLEMAVSGLGERVGKLEMSSDGLQSIVGNVRDRIIVVEERMKVLWKDDVATSRSPRRLNEKGTNILNGSGIKEIVEARKDDFLSALKSRGLKNPYDAEQWTLQVVNDLKNDSNIVEKLKTGAFSVGADIDTVLLVGGFYLRDLIFPELGFSLEDLDKPKVS